MFNRDYKALQSKYDDVNKELLASNRTIEVMTVEVEDYKSRIEDLNEGKQLLESSHKAEVEALKQQLKETENSVNARVNSALASVGVTNFAVETISTPSQMSPQEALNKFMALSGNEKTEWFKNNKELITQALKLKQ